MVDASAPASEFPAASEPVQKASGSEAESNAEALPVIDMVPILELAEAKVCSCSVNDRVGVFDASISSALDSKAVDVASAAPRLALLIFQTLPIYSDRRSQASVERALTKALKRETAFVKAFAGALVQACAKPGSVSASVAGLVRYKLLKWSCLLLRERGDAIVGVRAAFSRLVVAQGTLLTVALGDEPRLKRASLHAVNEMLGAVPSLAAAYLAELKSTPVTLTTVGIAHPLLTYFLETKARGAEGAAAADGVANGAADAVSAAPGSAAEAKAFFLETYSKLVLSSRERPPHVASEAFAPLLHSLEHSEFKGTLFPTAAKMLKRNPELIMDAVGYLLSTVRLDLSAYAPELLPTLALQARHQNAATREEAIGVFAVAAKQCSDSDSIRTMFAYLKGVLAGKEGKLTSVYQKVGVYQTLRALSSFSPPGPNAMAPAVAADVAEFLMSAYAGDTNEEVLASILSALGEWLARTARQAPAATSAFVTARLAKEKETLRRCMLRCLRMAFRNPHVREKLVPCVDALVALVKSGVAKPTMRLDGVYALLLAASIAALDLGSEEKLAKEKVWQLVLQGDPPFLSTAIVPKVTGEEDLLALLELVEVVLLHHSASVSTGHAAAVSTNELCRLAVHLLWHPLSSVRKAAHAMVARFHAISPLLSDSLLDALSLSLPPLEDLAAAAAVSTGDSPEAAASPESAADRLPPPQLLGQALLVVAGTGAVAERVGVAARVMLLAHHRLVAGGRKRDVVWQELVRAWQRRAYEVSATLAAEPVVVAKILTGPAGLASSRPAQSDAAIAAIQSAMRLIPAEFFQPLVTELEAVGQREEHDALTESEIKIFNTPEGMLSAEDGVYVAAVVRDKNVRQARGKLKLYGAELDDDDEEEEPSKPAPAAAAAKKSAGARDKLKLYGAELDDDDEEEGKPTPAAAPAKKPSAATPGARGAAETSGPKGVAGRGAGKKDTGKPGAKKAIPIPFPCVYSTRCLYLQATPARGGAGAGGAKGAAGRGAGKKDAGKPGAKKAAAGEGEKGKTAKEEAREALLLEEEKVRERVRGIQRHTGVLVRALGAAAAANPAFSHDQLPQLVASILPLLRSPLIPSQAFDALALVMRCLSPALQPFSWDVASALCSVSLAGESLAEQLKEESAEEGEEEGGDGKRRRKKEESVVDRVVRAVWAACKEGGSLPAATFGAVFPIFERVLRANKKTRLHDSIISILQLHTSPFITLPRLAMISVLYHVLGRVRIYHSRVQPILRELCRGLKSDEIGGALEGLFAEQAHVREACLEAVKYIPTLAAGKAPQDQYVACAIWMAQYDPEPANAEAAEMVWDMYGHELGPEYAPNLIVSLGNPSQEVRLAAAEAMAAAMDEYRGTIQASLSSLFSLYVRDAPPQTAMWRPQDDATWHSREGMALAMRAAADVLTTKELPLVATFLISKALADPNEEVRRRMVEAGLAIINRHGKENVGLLLPIFENYLDRKADNEHSYDLVREGVVVFLGALAKHLAPEDPKVTLILARLLEVLNTPSEAVQRAVSDCLPPLMPAISLKEGGAQALIAQQLKVLLTSDRFAERRGAAFGLAGVVKGLGLRSIRDYGVLQALIKGVEDKSCRIFWCATPTQPLIVSQHPPLPLPLPSPLPPTISYVIHILPYLLVCYSDTATPVREATVHASRCIMGQLSAPGVKLILPALLKGLEEKAWRSKQGSVQLLGAMAFCAPRQLSHCLPLVVPKLSEVLTDTHPKVQAAAHTSLQQVGSVIRNPEIAALVPSLLDGIANPNKHTRACLDLLLQTTFVNSIDAASLALVIPIVHRALRERSSDIKKRAAQIVGNTVSLVTDHSSLLPYLNLLLPGLKKVLLDPHPDVRTVAAKAFGSLVRGVGEHEFPDLVPWMLETIGSDASSVERSGAAQGLSEVLGAQGRHRFELLLPDLLAGCSHKVATVRDGHLTLFKYLPLAFGAPFQNYLPQVLPAILDGLADESESVRDAALAAGHVLVQQYAISSLPLLLPAVEEGLFSDSWRIRQSSMELLGDLLFKVAGTSGKVVLEGGSDDEGASTEAQGRAILDVLGLERRNEVLAAVYIVRSDVSLSVRQSAVHVWKTIVANTPRTLKEIMPTLMRLLIDSLGSPSFERRQMASRAIGELVRKLGERVLPSVVPILSAGLKDPNPATRQGVCCGLGEVMNAAGRQNLTSHLDDLIGTIRTALCDEDAEVREAAAQAFSTLYKSAGMQAIDEIVPALLHSLEDPHTSATALDGLKQILSVRTTVVLPHILPKLVKPPLTEFKAHALGALAEVAGAGMCVHLATVLPPLLNEMGQMEESALRSMAVASAEAVVKGVDEEGLDSLIGELTHALSDNSAVMRRGAAKLLGTFCKITRVDLEEELPSLMAILIVMLADPDEACVKVAWEALGSVTSTIPKESLPVHLKVVRDAVATARDRERRKRKGVPMLVAGFCLPKGLQPVLQIYLQALMLGSAEMREAAADGLAELIDVASEAALRPFVVPITGPLIRIVGDRFPWQVKAAILSTLAILISKGGIALKPFLPQLQTTFIRCLQDSNRTVRSRAAKALGRLTALNPRVDALISDLLNSIQTADGAVKESMLMAIRGVVRHGGKAASPASLERLSSSLQAVLFASDSDDDSVVRSVAARALGGTAQYLSEPDYLSLLSALAAPLPSSRPWSHRLAAALALSSLLRHTASRPAPLSASQLTAVGDKAAVAIRAHAGDDKVPVRETAAKSAGRWLVLFGMGGGSAAGVVGVLASLLGDAASDVRRRALSAVKMVAKKEPIPAKLMAALGPPLSECLKDTSQPVRMAAERTILHAFQLSKGPDQVTAAQKYLTGLESRRIAKMPVVSDGSDDSEDDDAQDD
ncbi:unnamed protein product [Closterium sp. Yama58-4]|nr:unnamed protein product [Closterium sp. Yama58-4]